MYSIEINIFDRLLITDYSLIFIQIFEQLQFKDSIFKFSLHTDCIAMFSFHFFNILFLYFYKNKSFRHVYLEALYIFLISFFCVSSKLHSYSIIIDICFVELNFLSYIEVLTFHINHTILNQWLLCTKLCFFRLHYKYSLLLLLPLSVGDNAAISFSS